MNQLSMDSLLHGLHLAFINLQPWMVAIIMPIAGLLFAAVFGLSGMYFHHRKQELWHQTARLALEKGQPLPPIIDADEVSRRTNPQTRWRGLMIGGLINLGVGTGLFVALAQIPNTSFNLGYFGCIPAFIGLALLIGAVVEGLAARSR